MTTILHRDVLYCYHLSRRCYNMRYAIKSKKKIVQAYPLGQGHPMETALIEEGAIRLLPDGSYALFSQEAVNGQGQIAYAGDYFKVDTIDGRHYPYPNDREFFLSNQDRKSVV